ncbi:cytochrome c-type protein [Betaproteobacteria bacterium]|nr:cytochrome c-type protein [Betaproteobacteria bacterium]GHT93113.1 cytochrome c-type protein [Betaproteobacteria bacterium]GHT97946.1 cytochrome c-type protein [Betaproteobacteria bacterium]GHU02532.1 cytochrome c-type protein [Betaproteobacteria bacterium]GHU09359.1 cytochrome c-type protein [Betaproteobacteria bacterium]
MSIEEKFGFFKRLRFIGPLAVLVIFVAGILFWATFNYALEWTNREEFCISCHAMKDNVYREYQETAHYTNRSGVRASCPDCHVPRELGPKLVRKVQASAEVWHALAGTIDTPEKFEAKRLQLAEREWQRMRANNSQECRNCHDPKSFDYSRQGYRSVNQHVEGLDEGGKICIDCHQGVAHHRPQADQGFSQ